MSDDIQVNLRFSAEQLQALRDKHATQNNAEAVRLEYGIEPKKPPGFDYKQALREMRAEYKSTPQGRRNTDPSKTRTAVLKRWQQHVYEETGEWKTINTLQWHCNATRSRE